MRWLPLLLLVSCSARPAAPVPAPAPTPAPTPASAPAPTPAPTPASPPPPDPVTLIHDELGPSVPIVREEPFVLAGPGWTPASLASVTELVRKALAALYHDRFTTRPELPVAVYLFPSAAPYARFCVERLGEKCISPYGFYRPGSRSIVMNREGAQAPGGLSETGASQSRSNAGPGIGTLTHEMVHPLVEADFPDAPIWINEGLASLFEAPVLPRAGEIHGGKNWRLPRLRAALGSSKERPTTRLDTLFGMSDDTFRNDAEDLHYAMARYACQWLDARGKLWAFYRAWRDGVATDPTGEKAFASALGQTPHEANEAWATWVRSL
jgi:Protein of unknown function (DUF1570)